MRTIMGFLVWSVWSIVALGQEPTQLEPWRAGLLDIHHINTGKGECTFFVFPDGTTMLVDAGAAGSEKPWATDPRPDASRPPGEWIARYIAPLLRQADSERMDYAVISHFHWDHMGHVAPETPFNAMGAYQLSGITDVLDRIPTDTVIDRAWPDYGWPVPLDDLKMLNYMKFLHYQADHGGPRAEQVRVGARDQIKLKRDPDAFPNFEVRNIAANGSMWTGVDANTRKLIPEATDPKEIGENGLSISMRISYGAFDYFTGGDLSVRDFETAGPEEVWKDLETPIARVTGPVEALKANHHGNYDANGVPFLSALRPRVIVVATWGASQPAMSVYRRMISQRTYPGPRDIFVTNIMRETRTVYDVSKLKSDQGHVVIRVHPSSEYEVFNLDDSREGYIVKARFGRYSSH